VTPDVNDITLLEKMYIHRYPEHTVCVIHTRSVGDSQVIMPKKRHQTTHSTMVIRTIIPNNSCSKTSNWQIQCL